MPSSPPTADLPVCEAPQLSPSLKDGDGQVPVRQRRSQPRSLHCAPPKGAEGSVHVNAPRDWGYCGPGDPGSTVVVSPFEPTLAATLRHQ